MFFSDLWQVGQVVSADLYKVGAQIDLKRGLLKESPAHMCGTQFKEFLI